VFDEISGSKAVVHRQLLIALPVVLVLFAAGPAVEISVTVKHSAGTESKGSMGALLY
jgi:hypothetical protein